MHLLIPFACLQSPRVREAIGAQQLPNLHTLLRRLAPGRLDSAAADSLTPAHERMLARLQGISAPDGQVPWAALARYQAGHPAGTGSWAWVSPVHWDVGAAQIDMANPESLELHEDESRALVQAMQPYFEQDGMALQYESAGRWWASGPPLDGLASASLDRVAGREISPWMPARASLRRLQNEMQMLLYTHPVTAARTDRGAPAVNSFWLHGTGALAHAPLTPAPGTLVQAPLLRRAALAQDMQAWADAWQQTDRTHCAEAVQALRNGTSVELTLCGERSAQTFGPQRLSAAQRLSQWLRPRGLADLWERL